MMIFLKNVLVFVIVVVIGIVFGNIAWVLIKGLISSIANIFGRRK